MTKPAAAPATLAPFRHRVFLWLWLANWALAWLFAFPAAMLAIPMARRIVGWLTAAPRV